jgi:hypothetical protein
MNQSKQIRKILKARTLGILDGVGGAILYAILHPYLILLLPATPKEPLAILLSLTTLLLLALLISVSFLILFIWKFHVANKALLELNPHFYEHRQFDKWFDYYAKQIDKKEISS